jgi:hypothetical protein
MGLITRPHLFIIAPVDKWKGRVFFSACAAVGNDQTGCVIYWHEHPFGVHSHWVLYRSGASALVLTSGTGGVLRNRYLMFYRMHPL